VCAYVSVLSHLLLLSTLRKEFFDYYDLHVYDAYSTLNPSSLVLAILLRHCKYDTCNVHCSGQPLPVVTYTPEEIATWYVLGAFIDKHYIGYIGTRYTKDHKSLQRNADYSSAVNQ